MEQEIEEQEIEQQDFTENITKILELQKLALLVNHRTPACVFVRDSGHIEAVEFDLRQSKDNWDVHLTRDKHFSYKRVWAEADEENYQALMASFNSLLAGDFPSLFKVEVDTGVSVVVQLFTTNEDRQEFIALSTAKNSSLIFKESMELRTQGEV